MREKTSALLYVILSAAVMVLCRDHLGEKDYQNYGKQYQIFQKVLAVYDVEPDNFPRCDKCGVWSMECLVCEQ